MTTKTRNISKAAHDAVMHSKHIEKDIRHLVTDVLKEGKIEPEAIKQVLNEVVEGACSAANVKSGDNLEALKQVVTGIDNALSQFAEVSKLAIEEASSHLQEFSDHDLKRAMQDLQDLEVMFFDTLSDVAHKGHEGTHNALKQLLNHLQDSGSSVGRSVNDILSGLRRDFAAGGRLDDIQAADIAKAAGAIFARVSSGILAGIADTLEPKKK